MMKASPYTAPRTPSARPLRSGGNASPMTALATGKMPEAATPCNARPTNKTSNEGDRATTSEPAPNSSTSNV